jgi:uncharacterized protein YndB with AHSA1/START domain
MSEVRMQEVATSVVRKTLLLECSQEHAFRVFAQRMGQWWPADHHIGAAPFRDIIVEPCTGGQWYEIDTDERRGAWGSVLAWEPPHRLVLSWHLNTKFQFDPDMARASELHLLFVSLADRQTRVEFEHRGIERHGEGYQELRDRLDRGWVGILELFVKMARESAPPPMAPGAHSAGAP